MGGGKEGGRVKVNNPLKTPLYQEVVLALFSYFV